MFNLGFFELTLFGVIALIVLGPDKLVVVARTLGKWYGQFVRLSARLRQEFVSELQLNEVQAQLQAEIAQIRASEANIKAQMQELQNSLQKQTALGKPDTKSDTKAYHDELSKEQSSKDQLPKDKPTDNDNPQADQLHQLNKPTPLSGRFFLLGDYDKKRRLPNAPFLPNYKADKLLYQTYS